MVICIWDLSGTRTRYLFVRYHVLLQLSHMTWLDRSEGSNKWDWGEQHWY